jgi:uncharacterized protein YfaP (DUF2135 family)
MADEDYRRKLGKDGSTPEAPDRGSGFGGRIYSCSEPANEDGLTYVNWYFNGYGPPWTSSESDSKMRPVGRSGMCRAAWSTAEVRA